MPTFATPEPVRVDVDLSLAVGNIEVVASDRADTIVEVRPGDPARKADVRAAAETRVEQAGSKLLIEFTRHRRHMNMFSRNGSVDIRIELPAGSDLDADVAVGGLRCTGAIGSCRFTTHHGDIAVERAGGAVDVRTERGQVRVDDVAGPLRVTSVNGGVRVGRAGDDVEARNAKGAIRVDEVARGSVVLTTASGELEVGVREGTAAWLDVRTVAGRLRNSLETTERPDAGEDRVSVRARTYDGDIVIRRAS